ncbi:magnesium transporter CorA family protein [Lapillicoccus sp.]|uniref:magnesium transporter CorA family protein n=1 Tax=Lapillicoccus sp. TaxID=1909287 RepID=UPI0027C678E4|nr:magnesium transporter CorA family protein [Actinomycetota bacterium]
MSTTGVRTVLWRNGEIKDEGFPLEEISDHLEEDGSLVWVDLCEPDHGDLQKLADELSLDPLAVEDAIEAVSRAKATLHAHHTFVSVYATHLDIPNQEGGADVLPDAADLLASRLRLTKISAFVLQRGIVTIRDNDVFDMKEVVSRWRDNPDLLKLGGAALLHGLLDTIVDGHFDTVQELDDAIESLEDGLFAEQSSTRETQQRTFRIRKELVELRRVVLPMREVINTVLRHRTEMHKDGNELDGYWSDLYDHALRAAEWTESLRDMISTIFETSLSLQDARLNTVMKKLTGWAAIIAVPTAVTGWFGQNVPYPGFQQPWGVWLTTGVIVGLAATLYLVFKRKEWL